MHLRYLPCLLLFLSGCSSGPRAEQISPPVIALETSTEKATENSQIDISKPMPCNWWTLFHDEQLDQMIQMLFSRNPTLQVARAKILLATANAERVRASLWPNLYWGADVSRQKLSETGLIPFNLHPSRTAASNAFPVPAGSTGPFPIPVYFTQTETELILRYDFDIWGRNRNAVKAALGEEYAAMADTAYLQLELGIELSKAYFQLQIDYQREEVAQNIIRNQQDTVSLTQNRIQNQIEGNIPLTSSHANLATRTESLLQIQQDAAVQELKVKTLLAGNFMETISGIAIDKKSLPKIPFPTDLPLHLLVHRPDIQSKLWIIQSASKWINVAKADFYPDLNLAALFGFQTIHFHELFRWPSTYYNIDPAVTLPIFDRALFANLHASQVNYDIAIYEYNELVLKAAQEVLETLALLNLLQKQFNETTKRWESQEQQYILMQQRVENNINSKLDLLNSEIAMLNAKDQELTTLGNLIQILLSLIKALGGGYQSDVIYSQNSIPQGLSDDCKS